MVEESPLNFDTNYTMSPNLLRGISFKHDFNTMQEQSSIR